MNRSPRLRNQISAWTAMASVAAAVLVLVAPTFVSGQSRGGAERSGTGRTADRATDERSLRLTAAEYTRLQRVRQATGLTTDDLALLNVESENAESALRDLARWVRRNAPAIDAAEAQVTHALAREQEALRRINVGPRDRRQLAALPQLREAVDTTKADCNTLYERGATAAAARLGDNARADRARLRTPPTQTRRLDPQAAESRVALSTARRPSAASYQAMLSQLRQVEQDLLPVPAELAPDGSEFSDAERRELERFEP